MATPPAVEALGLSDLQEKLFESEVKKAFIVFAPPVDNKTLRIQDVASRKLG